MQKRCDLTHYFSNIEFNLYPELPIVPAAEIVVNLMTSHFQKTQSVQDSGRFCISRGIYIVPGQQRKRHLAQAYPGHFYYWFMLEYLCSRQSLVIDPFPIGINGKSIVPPGSGHQSLLITWYSLCPFGRLLRVCQSSQLLPSPSQGHPRNFHLLSCATLARLPQASFI